MPNGGDENLREKVRLLQSWRDDVAQEIRGLERQVKDLSATVARNTRRLDGIEKKEEIAKAVFEYAAEHAKRRLKWWHVVAIVAALIPGYVAMVVAIVRL